SDVRGQVGLHHRVIANDISFEPADVPGGADVQGTSQPFADRVEQAKDVPWTVRGFEDGVPQLVLTQEQFERDPALMSDVFLLLNARFRHPYFPWKEQWADFRDDVVNQHRLSAVLDGVSGAEEQGLATGDAEVDARIAEGLSTRIAPAELDERIHASR